MSADTKILINVSLSLVGNDPESPWPSEYGFCIPATPEDAEELQAMVDAIDEGRLFGWMMQQMAECTVGAGEWRDDYKNPGDPLEAITPQEVH